MVNWRALEASVDATVNAAFGERVRLSFMKNGAADPSRSIVDIRAILHVAGNNAVPVGKGMHSKLSAGQAGLVIERSKYSGPAIEVKDKVRASDRPGMPWFEVSEISDRYSNLLVLTLTQA